MEQFTKERAMEVLQEAKSLEYAIPGITAMTIDMIDTLLLKKREMLMKTTTFEKAELGDKVWDFQYGWGAVRDHRPEPDPGIEVTFPGRASVHYRFNGTYAHNRDINRTLFWGPIEVGTIPMRPPRKVKKIYWLNVSVQAGAVPYIGTRSYKTEEAAKKARNELAEGIQTVPVEIEDYEE